MMHRGWAAICDRCGFEYKSYQLRKEWQGLMVCVPCWESRHPQDFIRAVPDHQAVPWTRPEAADTFVPNCDIFGQSGYIGYGVVGCMVIGSTAVSLTTLHNLQEESQRL